MKHIANYVEFAEKTFEMSWLKALAAAVGALIGYFFPDEATQRLAIYVFVFVIADTATGMCAAKSTGQPIESAKFGRIISKLVAYSALVLVARMIPEAVRLAESVQATAVSAFLSAIVVNEAISVIENVKRMKVLRKGMLESLAKFVRGKSDNR